MNEVEIGWKVHRGEGMNSLEPSEKVPPWMEERGRCGQVVEDGHGKIGAQVRSHRTRRNLLRVCH